VASPETITNFISEIKVEIPKMKQRKYRPMRSYRRFTVQELLMIMLLRYGRTTPPFTSTQFSIAKIAKTVNRTIWTVMQRLYKLEISDFDIDFYLDD